MMFALRTRLRLVATLWLFFQAGVAAVIVPFCCCAPHQPPAASHQANCHESVPESQAPPAPAMKACCDPHVQALNALLGPVAILTATRAPVSLGYSDGIAPLLPQAVYWTAAVESPPPRA